MGFRRQGCVAHSDAAGVAPKMAQGSRVPSQGLWRVRESQVQRRFRGWGSKDDSASGSKGSLQEIALAHRIVASATVPNGIGLWGSRTRPRWVRCERTSLFCICLHGLASRVSVSYAGQNIGGLRRSGKSFLKSRSLQRTIPGEVSPCDFPDAS